MPSLTKWSCSPCLPPFLSALRSPFLAVSNLGCHSEFRFLVCAHCCRRRVDPAPNTNLTRQLLSAVAVWDILDLPQMNASTVHDSAKGPPSLPTHMLPTYARLLVLVRSSCAASLFSLPTQGT